MKLVRLYDPQYGPRLGMLSGERVYDITGIIGSGITSPVALLKHSGYELLTFLERRVTPYLDNAACYLYDELDVPARNGRRHLMRPLDPPEVWAAGVTYLQSRDAREFETQTKSIYDRVYEAERPEIFLKATPHRVVGPYDPVGLRSDSRWMVPEPELGLVLGVDGNIIGYIAGNDMSCRDIEGENPLYLPQAKIFKNCCSLGPILALDHPDFDPTSLTISCRISRQGAVIFDASTSTANLKRSFEELVQCLIRDNVILPGTVLLTGTCVVPPDEFSLEHGDLIEIAIDGLGVLRNRAECI